MSVMDKYKLIARDIPVYESEEHVDEQEREGWIVVDGSLYSRKWKED